MGPFTDKEFAMFAAAVLVVVQILSQPAGEELFRDPQFRNGFTLTAASHPAPKVEIGVLQTSETLSTQPDWRMPQWATRTLLEPRACERDKNGVWFADNVAKRIEIECAPDGLTRLLLEVRGSHEYTGQFRKAGEPWAHLLIEQSYPQPIKLSEFTRLDFTLDTRVPFCKRAAEPADKFDPGLHTAQVSAYWTIHDISPGRGDMIWFGIPIFDARYEVPPAHYAIDGGKADASGKFICVLDGKRFWMGNTGDGNWRLLKTDLVPLIKEALHIAQEQGHLPKAKLEDLALTSFNLGWELPGPYDAAIEFRGLSLRGSQH